MAIEVEVKGIISKERYEELLNFFKKEGKFINEDNQETHYFETKDDLRIQKNDFFSKICFKEGELHDEFREEIDIKCKKDEFDNLKRLFDNLGYGVLVKWFRKRHTYEWEGFTVTLDDTKGFGNIIEIEKVTTDEDKETALNLIKEKFQKLGIPISSKEELKKKFEHYRDNWKELIS